MDAPRLRVLMLTSDHLMIDRRILQEADTLIDNGASVTLLAGFECPRAESYRRGGIEIHRYAFDGVDPRLVRLMSALPLRGRVRSLALRICRRMIATLSGWNGFELFVLGHVLVRDFDVLHCHDYPLLRVAVEAARHKAVPLIYDAHELYHAQVQLPRSTQRAYRARERLLVRHCDAVITVNPFIARIMADDYAISLPEVILNAAVRARVSAPGLREHLKIGTTDRLVLYQGWISPERGIEVLVRAARHFPPGVRLVLIGYGEYEKELRRISIEQGTDNGRVIFFGRVDAEQLPPLTASADLGVIPYSGVDLNNYYCSPNKLFEYAAAGVPFLSNDLPFLRQISEQFGFGVLADLTSETEIADSVAAVFADGAAYARLKQAAEAAGTRLDWRIEGAKLRHIYRDVLERTGAGKKADRS